MFASAAAALARAIPIIRILSPMRSFRWAKTCSTFARTADLRPSALAVRLPIGRPRGFLRWMRLVMPFASSQSSFRLERQSVSAHTSLPVLAASTRPSRSLAPSWAAASVTYQEDTVNSALRVCHAWGMEKVQRRFGAGIGAWLRQAAAEEGRTRGSLARGLCEAADWRNAKGELCLASARRTGGPGGR